jgi:DNA-binding PadR family transcriptional regulator
VKVNRSRFAVLGLLSAHPSTGYDIRKTIEQELSHFWNESYGQIYPILNALAEERLATRRHKKQKGKPDRQIYSITPKGRQVLNEWLAEPSGVQIERNETLLKLFFAGGLGRAARRGLIESYRQKQQELLSELDEIEQALEGNGADEPPHALGLLTISHGRAEARARLRWCDQVLRELDALPRRKTPVRR